MKYELKPCPFCGGEAKLRKDEYRLGCHVECTVCGTRAKHILKDLEYCAIDRAVEVWNKRADEVNS